MQKDIRELVFEEDVFDPFADDGEDFEEDEQPLIGAPLEEADGASDPKPDLRPPRVRIEELLRQAPGQRRLLLKLIDFCREEKTGAEMDARTLELKEHNFSVYSPVVLRELLEKAGAIEYEPSEDELAAMEDSEEVKHETLSDGEDEVELDYLEICTAEPGVWRATEDGLAIVDSQDDFAAVRSLLGKEPQYQEVYRLILSASDSEQGAQAREIDALVNGLEILQEPRRYSGYFVGRLEREGAIEWVGGWRITEVGRAILGEMID